MKKEVFLWASYDFANTIFSALFITLFFPILIKVFLGGSEFHIGLTTGIAFFLGAFIVPFLGLISDLVGLRLPFVFFATVFCIVSTIAIGLVENLNLALILATLAILFYHISLDVYDALMVKIAPKAKLGFVSGFGIALGYFGTIFSVAIAFAVLSFFGFESKMGIKAAIIVTALLFGAFSIPVFLIKEKATPKIKSFKKIIRKSFLELKETFKKLKSSTWLFLLSSFLYNDGAQTAIVFFYLFGREMLGLTVKQFLLPYTIMALAAIIGAFLTGKTIDKFGNKKTLVSVLLVWILVILILIFKTTFSTYIFAGIVGGAALGGLWSVTRTALVQFVPKHKLGEMFGFHGLTEKFGGFLGPLVFGFIVASFGYKIGLFVLLLFFLVAFGIIFKLEF